MYAGKVYDTVGTDDKLLIDILLEEGFQVEIHGAYATFVRDVLGEDDLIEDTLTSQRGPLRDMKPALKQSRYGPYASKLGVGCDGGPSMR